ncbi:MAG: hypothetical protein COT91_02775, partial [Candidatus Doudnabacteria bacterium CG10_big_fil_rev_8_21_14_0_10_41_10]
MVEKVLDIESKATPAEIEYLQVAASFVETESVAEDEPEFILPDGKPAKTTGGTVSTVVGDGNVAPPPPASLTIKLLNSDEVCAGWREPIGEA